MSRTRREWPLNLDSILDIVTNVVGVMVLIAVMTVVDSQHLSISLGTPYLHPPPSNAEAVFYECREQRLVFLDKQSILHAAQAALAKRQAAAGAPPPIAEWPDLFEQTDIGNESYRLRVAIQENSPVWTLEPRRSGLGESIEDLQAENSKFRAALGALDPQRRFVYFIVRGDSFEVFQAARNLVRDRRLETGWLPLEPEALIAFGDSGTPLELQ